MKRLSCLVLLLAALVLLLAAVTTGPAQSSVSLGLRGSVCQQFGWGNPDFLNGSYRMLGQAAFARLERASGWAFELGAQHSFREDGWKTEQWYGCFEPPFITINQIRRNEHVYTASLGAQRRLLSTQGRKGRLLPLVQAFGGLVIAASRTRYDVDFHSTSDGVYRFYTRQERSHVSVMPGVTGTLTCNPTRHLQASLEGSYLADVTSLTTRLLAFPAIKQRLGLALGLAYCF